MFKFIWGMVTGFLCGMFICAIITTMVELTTIRKTVQSMRVQAVESGVAHWVVNTKGEITFIYNTNK